MIVARAPLRISLGGGGTDLLSYAKKRGGLVLSAAINHHVFIVVNRSHFDERLRVKTRESEDVEIFDELKDETVRAALEWAGIKNNIEVIFIGEISGGTGLGTSSAYLVNLVNALSQLNRRPLGPQELAEAACRVEIDMLGRPIGPQDQFMAAFGGIRLLRIHQDCSVTVEDPQIPFDTLEELRNNLLLFYTGQKRQSGKILGEQKKALDMDDPVTLRHYDDIKDLGLRILEALQSNNLVRFGELMHEHWESKRLLPGGTTNSEIDRTYELARKHGAIGGKIIGAGGGGYFAFLADPGKKKALRAVLQQHGLREMPFDYDYEGAVLSTAFLHRHEAVPRLQIHSQR